MPDLPSPSAIPFPNSTVFPTETRNAFVGALNAAKDLPEDRNTLRSDIDGAVINDGPLTFGQISNLVGDYLKVGGDFVALEASALVASGNPELGGILDGVSTGFSFVGSELQAAGEPSPVTNTSSTSPLTDAQLAQVAAQLAAMQPTTPASTGIDTTNTTPPAVTTPAALTNTTTPPMSPDTTVPAPTDTGLTANTGPIAPTQDGSVDPREILYALNQGDVALSAQSQIQYETSQGDTDLATQLQNALNQGNIGNTAQVQDSQLQGLELQNQLEQTNPGLDAQIQTGLSSDITSQVAATSSTDDTGTGTSPAATGIDDTSGSDVPSPIPAYVPPASTPVNPVGNAASDPVVLQSGVTISSDSSEFYNVTGNNLSENIGITNTSPVFINGSADSLSLSAATGSFAITDNGQGTAIDLTGFAPSAGATITLNDFQNDTIGSIILPSQYATASAAVAALQSDGQGGSILPLSNGASLHFVGDTSLTAASFTAGTA